MSVRTYAPKNILANFGSILIGGYADGTFFKAERADDGFTKKVGASGEVARVKSNDHSGKVTFTLLASSPTNDLLMAQAAQDELLSTGVAPLMVKDSGGTTQVSGANAWIMKIPDIEFSKDLATRTWVLEVEDLIMFVGGNL